MFSSLSLGLNILLSAIVILAAITVILFAVCAVAIHIMLVKPPVSKEIKPNKLLGDNFPELANFNIKNIKILKSLPYDTVTVTADDGVRLVSYFYKNPVKTDITVLCIHGYNSNGYGDYGAKGLAYLNAGYNVFIANLRHAAESEGKYIGFGVLEKNDIIKYVEYINSVYPDGKIIIEGTSMGGATVMQASSHDLTPNVKGIIDDCGFTTVWEEVSFVLRSVGHLPSFPIVNILEFYAKLFAKYDFRSSDSRKEVAKARVPMLFIHGDNDTFVPCQMGKECFEACTTEKELFIVKGASHAGAYFTDPDGFMEKVNNFIKKCTAVTADEN